MTKEIAVLVVLSFVAFLFTGCTAEQADDELLHTSETAISDEVILTNESEQFGEATETRSEESITEQEPSQITVSEVEMKSDTTEHQQQFEVARPSVAQAQPPVTVPPAATPKPTQPAPTTPQRPVQTTQPTPTQPSTPVAEPAPIATQPAPPPEPAPTPQPTPAPTPVPAPPAEPPPARTICNTCGADITGNVPAHGTAHLLNDEDFSYRVE